MSSEILNLGPSGSAAQPAGPSPGSQICNITNEEIIFITKQWGKRKGIKNRTITKEQIIWPRPTIPTTRQSREVSDEQTPKEECKEVSNEEAKKTSRVIRVFNIGAFTVFAASVWLKEKHSRHSRHSWCLRLLTASSKHQSP